MQGKHLDDLDPGQRIVTPARTVTEADITHFAGLSGDYNAIHTDREFVRTTPFGAPIAHGLLVVSILSGLVERTGIHEGTIVALRRMEGLEFLKPVFGGDTVHGELEVSRKEPRETTGQVDFRLTGCNQRGEAVLEMTYGVILKKRAPGATEGQA